jgi:hypothetical protein
MKMLFSSSDTSDVNEMGQRLVKAGIPCQIRTLAPEPSVPRSHAELWIQKPEDFRTAVVIFSTPNLRR